MEASVTSLHEFLNGTEKKFIIPVYQRNYSWQEENCQQFIDDIKKAGESQINSHFIGSVIFVQGLRDIYTVIDGQQRVTTFLFLKAMYDSSYISAKDLMDYVKTDFIKPMIFKDSFDEVALKVVRSVKLQLNQDDNSVLVKIFRNEFDSLSAKEKFSNVYLNYMFFKKELKDIDNSIREFIDGFKKLKIIKVLLHKDEQPQLIFEALNSTGMQLQVSDLIRNHLLMSNIDKQNEFYEKYWYKIENYLTNEHIENFVKSFLIIKTLKISTQKSLYHDFKLYSQKEQNSEEILKELLFYSRIYSDILFLKVNDQEINKYIKYISQTGLDVFHTFLIDLLTKWQREKISREDTINILKLLDNYLIRSVISERNSNGFNKNIPTLIKSLNSFKSFKQELFSNHGKNLYFIRDDEFKESILSHKIYQTKKMNGGLYFLYRIEEHISNKEIVPVESLTVEHIFPQKAQAKEWKVQGWETIKNEKLNTLGNLTLTAINSELSNKPFKLKKELFKTSNLSLNKYFFDQNITHWNLNEIEKRAKYIADKSLEIWAEPEGLNEEIEISSFDLTDNVDITSKLPKSFELFGSDEMEVSRWKDLYLKVIEQLYKHHTDLFDTQLKLDVFNKNRTLFAKQPENLREARAFSYFYIETSLSSMYILSNLRIIFDILNLEKYELVINLKV